MPKHLASDHDDASRSRSRQRARTEVNEHRSVWDRLSLQKIGNWLKRDDESLLSDKSDKQGPLDNKENARPQTSGATAAQNSSVFNRRSSRRVVPGLPRPLTFKRMNSEKRDNLLKVPTEQETRRAVSVDRRESIVKTRTLTPPPLPAPSVSAPNVLSPIESDSQQPGPLIGGEQGSNIPAGSRQVDYTLDEDIHKLPEGEDPPIELVGEPVSQANSRRSSVAIDDILLQDELDAKWILNLSMHFRDLSDREKFFVTFAEEPNKWRRVTVSCDYRHMELDSLEADLKSLHYQRDKSSRIYEAIRDSLRDIQFYDTVTNLKLQTSEGRLHVHVTEDVNEIIPYPSLSAVEHLTCERFREGDLVFDSHISGFVYKINVDGRTFIKKEIPGPDAVEEFLYEINALCALHDSKSVIRFEGIIVDDRNELIKGLLISYAQQGALVDLIYDLRNSNEMPWVRREKWASQIVQGLSELHEAGYVQGDFTLSNIVVNGEDDAKIIDINRRGCPVGWEPPELARLIQSGQKISIYIGVKSDIFQLGMVLWALAEQVDEPERQERPLARSRSRSSDVPEYFKNIVQACLSDSPCDRPSARDILQQFPSPVPRPHLLSSNESRQLSPVSKHETGCVNSGTTGDIDVTAKPRQHSRSRSSFSNIHVPSAEYIDSVGSYILPSAPAGRERSLRSSRSDSGNRRSAYSLPPGRRSVMSLDDSELEHELASLPASRDTRWEQIYVDGDTKLVQRGGGDIDLQDYTHRDPKDVCITTPPNELDVSFISNGVVDASTVSLAGTTDALPQTPQSTSSSPKSNHSLRPKNAVGSKASFTERVHQLAGAHNRTSLPSQFPNPNTLAALESEIAFDSSVPSSTFSSRVNTGFSEIFHRPVHQDSGFSEEEQHKLESASYAAERIRESLEDKGIMVSAAPKEELTVDGRLWDAEGAIPFGNGVKGTELMLNPKFAPSPSGEFAASSLLPSISHGFLDAKEASDKAVEEKSSNNTIRPPSILIPQFHHTIPEVIDIRPPSTTPLTGS